MYRTEAMVFQHLYWPDIIDAVRKEVTNCDTCQSTKRSNIKYGKLPAKLAEEISWDKLFVDIIAPYAIGRKLKKYKLHLKYVSIIDPVTGWFEIMQYDDKNKYQSKNWLKLRGFLDTLDQYKSRMTKDHNLLVTSL